MLKLKRLTNAKNSLIMGQEGADSSLQNNEAPLSKRFKETPVGTETKNFRIEKSAQNEKNIFDENIVIYPPRRYLRRRNWQSRCLPPKDQSNRLEKVEISENLGAAFGLFNINHFLNYTSDEIYSNGHQFQAFATCLIAFGESYITPESEWNANILDKILAEGQKLYRKSQDEIGRPLIVKEQIQKSFQLCGNTMDVHLTEPIVIGVVYTENPKVYNMEAGLAMFFQVHSHCLCEVEGVYFVIWRRNDAYFLFDCYGRNLRLLRDHRTGPAALICVTTISEVSILLRSMSNICSKSVYTLYAMKKQVLSSDCEENIFESDAQRIQYFHVVEPMHVIMEGKNNIEIEPFKDDSCGQAISVALMAIVYSEANTSNIWDPSAIDKILMLGRKFYKKCVRDKDQFTLENIPQNIPIEHFIVTLQVLPNFVQTTWTIDGTTHVHKGVTKLKGIFTETTIRNVIMQVNQKSYGIWKQNNQFYSLDLYQSTLRQGYSESSMMKPALHMFDTLESLCYSLSRQVIQAPYDSTCLIHVVTVLNIQQDKNFIKESTKNMPYCGNVIERGAGKWVTPSSDLTVSDVQDREDLKLHLDAFDAPEKDVNNLGSHGNRSMSAKDRIFDSIKNSENCFSSTVSQMASERSTYRTSTSSGFEKKSSQSDTEEISSETLSSRARIPKLVKNESLSTKSNMNCPGHPIISLEGKRVKSEEYRWSFPTLGSMDSNKSNASSQMKTNRSTENASIQIETLFHQSKISTHKYPVLIRKANILEPKSTKYSRNCHPGLLRDKTNIAVIGSKTGSYESLKNLLKAGFKVTDRILAVTPWRSYVIFEFDCNFFLYEKCTCNAEYFRRLDLSTGTAGLLQFITLHDAIIYIIDGKGESLNFS